MRRAAAKRPSLGGFKGEERLAHDHGIQEVRLTWREGQLPHLSTSSTTTGTGRLGVLALLVSRAGFGVAEVLPSWA
jgi:hypothetical protein